MRRAVFALATLLSTLPVSAAEVAPALQKLCDKLCGAWQQDNTTYAYELDAAAGLMHGLVTTPDGTAGVMLYGWDTEKKVIWMMQTVHGDNPSVGTLTLTDEGFSYTIKTYGIEETYTAVAKFDGPYAYSEFFSFSGADGTHADGSSGPYRRLKQ